MFYTDFAKTGYVLRVTRFSMARKVKMGTEYCGPLIELLRQLFAAENHQVFYQIYCGHHGDKQKQGGQADLDLGQQPIWYLDGEQVVKPLTQQQPDEHQRYALRIIKFFYFL